VAAQETRQWRQWAQRQGFTRPAQFLSVCGGQGVEGGQVDVTATLREDDCPVQHADGSLGTLLQRNQLEAHLEARLGAGGRLSFKRNMAVVER
jgi:hypothetical protein